MQMQLMQFDFGGNVVRAVQDGDGEPMFVAADVLAALALDRKALERLDDDEKGVNSIHTPGGEQEVTVVNESGLYSLILGSRKPQAKAFKRWVTHEVLPTIRRTGSYSTQQASGSPQTKPSALANDWIDQSMRNAQTLIDIALETVGEEEALRRAPGGLSRPDVAMGLAGLLLKRQRLIMEFDDVNHPTLKWLHSKIVLVDPRESDWADRLVKSLSREQIAQILNAATRRMIG